MKPRELVFARVAPSAIRRREVANSIKRQYDVVSGGAGQPIDLAEPSPPAGMLAILDLPVPSETRLKALFDLTAAEARLAQRLARGDSVEEVAQTLSIKMTTARTQLAAIFAKTDTRRQAKLVAILSRVAHLG
jgi:DNA-binding CsgD family transcriptional regulator